MVWSVVELMGQHGVGPGKKKAVRTLEYRFFVKLNGAKLTSPPKHAKKRKEGGEGKGKRRNGKKPSKCSVQRGWSLNVFNKEG